jgi:asparagine synthetase B (glutamine-hydrolysing)
VNLLDIIDYPQIRYTNLSEDDIISRCTAGRPLPCGQYAFAVARGNSIRLARDPIGCNKLFFGLNGEGQLVAGNRAVQVWHRGVALAAIGSCPPGHVLEVSRGGVRDLGGSDVSGIAPDLGLSVADFSAESRAILDQAFTWLASEFKGCRFVVCLSGGLDSSLVASFAATHLSNVAAASFTYLDRGDLQRLALGAPTTELEVSEDFRCAAAVATALEMPFLPVVRSREAVADAVRSSVQLCQDWRDFNVHCATVNLFLAQDIRAAFPGEKVVVLTGDLMNEYVCDYSEERVGNTVYYKIPRIPMDKRRRYFVRGLDAGDREIGVFSAYGLVACQPFAVLAERYIRIPAPLLEQPDLKWALNGPLLAPQVMAHVNRAKTRAQVGGKDLGTLGLYHQLGIGEDQLRRAWQDQFPTERPETCDEFIQFGRYKAPRYAQDK